MLDVFFLFFLSVLPNSDITETQIEVENVELKDPLSDLLSEDELNDNIENLNNDFKIKNMNTDNLQKGALKPDETVAVISTTKGDIVLRFFEEEAPKTVENFLGLAKKSYYDDIIFHRVIEGFMIQGGDPTGTGRGGESFWGKPFDDEFSTNRKNKKGSISMANAGPKTNGSQFFINTNDNLFLDNKHSVFGEVISGLDIVESIEKSNTDSNDKPLEEVKINNIKVLKFSEYNK
jgi:cyclophilin family peptidyl-prolyl cis-trans isomerase